MLQALLRDYKTFAILISLSILILLFDNWGVLNVPKSALQFITSPIQYGLYKTSQGVGKQFEFIVLTRRTLQEKDALEEQMGIVLAENTRLRRELAEAQSFLEQQNTLDLQTYNLIPARPIGLSRYLIIDKGSDDGLKINQTVIYKDNYIGKIHHISPKKSEVLLLSDPDSKVAAFVNNKDGKAKGIIIGEFGSEILLDKILHQEAVSKDDLIYTEGSELDIPRGLILGQVSEVLSQDNEVFKQAKVRNVFDVADLDVVFIVNN